MKVAQYLMNAGWRAFLLKMVGKTHKIERKTDFMEYDKSYSCIVSAANSSGFGKAVFSIVSIILSCSGLSCLIAS